MKNYKYKTFNLLTSRKRGSREALDQKKVMSIKNKQSKGLPFLKKGVYVKDTMQRLRENDDRGSVKNTLCTQSISRIRVGARVVSLRSVL